MNRGDATPFDDLGSADLIVDHVYRGGALNDIRDDPISKLFPAVGPQRGVGNQGGFRMARSGNAVRLAVLFSTGAERDWPDELDLFSGRYIYYGDNRSAGRDLHDTRRGGNRLLAEVFQRTHLTAADRATVPPFLLLESTGSRRDVRFRGVLVPGSPGVARDEDLFAVWRSTSGHRFQNYRAVFTILDEATVSRVWLESCMRGDPLAQSCPAAWKSWVETGVHTPLMAPPTTTIRTKGEQLPSSEDDNKMLALIRAHFSSRPVGFEQFAADVWQRSDPHVGNVEVTRPWRDGGRDAIGEFLIGPPTDPVAVEFAIEAKCYGPSNAVGVKEVSRLISRLRHRQFGVLITTSYVHAQAYREVRDDAHPVVIVSGRDLVRLVKGQHLDSVTLLRRHLESRYPVP